MTRKDFIIIAAALAAGRPKPWWDANKQVQWDLDVRAIARVLAQSNPRFDYDRFYEDCNA